MDKNMKKWALAICSVFLVAGMLGTLGMATDVKVYDMYVQPYMISLNANSDSNAEFVTVVTFACYLDGRTITEADADFIIGEDVVTSTDNIRVTREGVCQAYFDKAEIKGYAIDNKLKGETEITVSGSYVYKPIGGDVLTGPIAFTGDGVVFFR